MEEEPYPYLAPDRHLHQSLEELSSLCSSRNSAENAMYIVRTAFQQQRGSRCVQSPACSWLAWPASCGYLWVSARQGHILERRPKLPQPLHIQIQLRSEKQCVFRHV